MGGHPEHSGAWRLATLPHNLLHAATKRGVHVVMETWKLLEVYVQLRELCAKPGSANGSTCRAGHVAVLVPSLGGEGGIPHETKDEEDEEELRA